MRFRALARLPRSYREGLVRDREITRRRGDGESESRALSVADSESAPPGDAEGMAFAARMVAVTEQLSKRLMDGGSIERRDLSNQLLNLSKLIDHTVASNQIPFQQQFVYKCFKQFTFFKYDEMLRPSVMVLMLSIKSACTAGWFSNSEVEDFMQTYTFLSGYFLLDGECAKPPSSLSGPVSKDISDAEAFIANICIRYYPRFVILSVLVALTAKPGYDSLGVDFQVTSQLAPYTKLRLFVCQKDDTSTSACLVTPPLLSFLVNGKSVEKRVYVASYPEPGPQLPSDITSMLRIGCNFLQIVGESAANYFVAVAIMGPMPWSSSSLRLEDYSPPPVAEIDDEVIVGRTRVSLRCPISLKRILTPVKGVSCRHHQAFDYDSYIEINDRRPSWRCPCCNTNANCSELRLDRQMEQILKEVDQNLCDVMINHDGSWAPDVPADETDVAYIQTDGEILGDSLAERFEESLIVISDDEEADQQVGTLVSPRGSHLAQFSTVSTTNVNVVDVVDRKPDIRTIFANDAVCAAPTHTPVTTASRENPILSAIYSPISEIPLGGPGIAATVGSVQASPGGYMNTTQSAVRSPSSWVPTNGFWSTSGPPSDSRPVTMERQLHTQPSRTSVIQALPAQTQYSNPNDRGGVTLTGQVSTLPTMPALQVPSTGQTPSLLPTTLAHEVQALQHQLQNSDRLDVLMIEELRQLQQQQQQQQQLQQQQQQQQQQQLQQQQRQEQQQLLQQQQLQQQAYNQSSAVRMQSHQDGNQRNQRHGPRASQQQNVVQSMHGHAREARPHPFTGASSHQAGPGQHNSNQLGQHMQYPLNSNLQNPQPVQDYYHRHRLSQQLQQVVINTSNQRGSPLPVANGGPLPGHGAPTGGSPRDVAAQMPSYSTYSGRTTSVANIPAAGTSSNYAAVEGWVPPPQLTNWRPAGTPRMRGAIGGGSTAGLSSGLRGTNPTGVVQSGQVNIRTRVSPNAVNAVPAPPSPTISQGTMLWTGAGRAPFNTGGSGDVFMTPEPAANITTLDDISWPSTLLDNSQIDNIGHNDSVSWIDDSLFNPMSPPPQ